LSLAIKQKILEIKQLKYVHILSDEIAREIKKECMDIPPMERASKD